MGSWFSSCTCVQRVALEAGGRVVGQCSGSLCCSMVNGSSSSSSGDKDVAWGWSQRTCNISPHEGEAPKIQKLVLYEGLAQVY